MSKFFRFSLFVCFLALAAFILSHVTKFSQVYAEPIASSFTPVADAYVYEASPSVNFGTNTSISVDGSPFKSAYLRFAPSGLSGTITKATLRVYANSAQTTGYEVHALADNTWSESAITYNNAPAYTSEIAGVSGATTAGTWTSVEITPLVTGNDVVNLVLTTSSVTNLNLASRNSSNPPELIIETEGSLVSPSPFPSASPFFSPSPSPSAFPSPTPSGQVTIAAVGDMVCGATSTGASCKQMEVSDVILGMNADAFLALGDVQYEKGEYADFLNFYDPSYGRLNNIVKPAIGNHEYNDPSATDPTQVGYWDYFNGIGNASGPAGDRSKGYYSYNLGDWHVIALNTNCSKIGGCSAGSAQGTWLRADLEANTKSCIIAYGHHPLFSSGGRATTTVKPLWQTLQEFGTDVYLAGHDHTYERFAYQNADGVVDPNGIREFVVGSGGRNHTHLESLASNSEVFDDTSYGALKMTLNPTGYVWQFQPIVGDTFTDSGMGTCHDPISSPVPSPSVAPSPSATPLPQAVTFTAVADAYVYENNPTVNYGSNISIGVDGSPTKTSYLRFDLTGLPGTITSATLRIYANSGQAAGYRVHSVSDNSWGETTITYANAPVYSPVIVGSSGPITAATWTSADVTSLISGNGSLNLALDTTSVTNLNLASRNSARPPELVVQFQ